ncbi:ATP-binding cassette subfamily B protein [Ilumatobacter fluminis]|uniref:ATP-binding cassette subfamily B protein n=1 Tax=Ilumatobacter fluminis TaxID=467091 RepID=A0A4R7I5G1_9ACTN|nr:ABC transporter ATP-binding protein/permease [Ilumatobacter fluminis]TDT18494.1 ATP-binding cassette subfamily B protein [Ilumatobacter fluminis]
MALLAVTAAAGGLAEALALLLVVQLTLALAAGPASPIELPLVEIALSPSVCIIVAGVAALCGLFSHLGVAWLTADIGSTVLANSRSNVVARFTEAGWPTQAVQREGSLQETVTTLSARTSTLANSIAKWIAQLVSLAMLLAAAFAVDPATTSVILIAGALLVAALRPLTNRNLNLSRLFVASNARFAEEVSGLSSMAMEVRVFGVQVAARDAVEALNREARLRQRNSRFAVEASSKLLRDLTMLLLVLGIGGLIWAGQENVGGLAAAAALVVRSLAAAQGANTAHHAAVESVPALDALTDRLEQLNSGRITTGRAELSRLDSIAFKSVSYSYNPSFPAIRDVSIEIGSGEAIGVVGPSGGGKSTFVQLLLRLRPPSEGSILVNGQDYLDFDAQDWSALVSFVPQEPGLVEATVAENIAFWRDIPRSRVREAARNANILDEIERLPKGFDTMLGPRGTGLSGGQKQRVAIARALAGEPALLILDEPSSALDAQSEELLQSTLNELRGRTTLIIVAHRLSTVEACDRLIVLESGEVTSVGSPSDLLRQPRFFRRVQEGPHV